MKLKTYLADNDLTFEQFAKICNVSKGTIMNILSGRDPKFSTVKKIVEITNGIVSYSDLANLLKDKNENKTKNSKKTLQ